MDSVTKNRKAEENGEAGSGKRLIPEDAAIQHPDVLDAVHAITVCDPTQRKLFIRGLALDITTEDIHILFSRYGDLEEAIVILDKVTVKSKGYGFITFKHIDGALLALKEPRRRINGRMTIAQLANQPLAVNVLMRMIYVGNVPQDISADRLLAHFSSYGERDEGPLGFDKQTGKSRGFALFVYKTAEAAKASLLDATKNIDGHQLICKLAIEGKKGKPGQTVVGAGRVQAPTSVPGEIAGDGLGLWPPSSM